MILFWHRACSLLAYVEGMDQSSESSIRKRMRLRLINFRLRVLFSPNCPPSILYQMFCPPCFAYFLCECNLINSVNVMISESCSCPFILFKSKYPAITSLCNGADSCHHDPTSDLHTLDTCGGSSRLSNWLWLQYSGGFCTRIHENASHKINDEGRL